MRKIRQAGMVVLIGLGVILMGYPWFSNWLYQHHVASSANVYEQYAAESGTSEITKQLEAARRYNQELVNSRVMLTEPYCDTSLPEDIRYEEVLNPTENGMMCFVEIPKINVSLPVYHGTSEKVLQSGVGHLKNTSLPVGGESCHAVLSGHRGLANAKIFTDLNKMEVGDVFYIKVLHHTFAYQVDQILTVLPSDTDSLQIEKGKDYVTLVTCTPYAVNTHRLLVRGTRIPYEEAQKIDEEVGLQRTIPFNLILLIAGIIALIIIWVSIKYHKRRKEKKHEQNN